MSVREEFLQAHISAEALSGVFLPVPYMLQHHYHFKQLHHYCIYCTPSSSNKGGSHNKYRTVLICLLPTPFVLVDIKGGEHISPLSRSHSNCQGVE